MLLSNEGEGGLPESLAEVRGEQPVDQWIDHGIHVAK